MEILFSSTSHHKLSEFRRLFAGTSIEIRSPADLGLPILKVAETGQTFAANASLKAHAYLEAYRIPVLADDSGLCVDALAGAPGLRSHRFGPAELDDGGRVDYLLQMMQSIAAPYRTAHYVCALALYLPDKRTMRVEGACYGSITQEVQAGSTGFGYDPVFRPSGQARTVAQMTPEQKDTLSHRGKAARKLHAAAIQMGLVSGTLKV
jgi:XTP/dITP diphosphohydrolase